MAAQQSGRVRYVVTAMIKVINLNFVNDIDEWLSHHNQCILVVRRSGRVNPSAITPIRLAKNTPPDKLYRNTNNTSRIIRGFFGASGN